jgi:DNA-binding transcriptional ArsR family regulator
MNNKTTSVKKMKPHAKKAAGFLKAIAHPDRLMILCQLVDGEQNVGELLQLSTLSQSAFSQHLAVLRKYQLVKIRKEAQSVFYSLANDNVINIIQILQRSFCPRGE